MILATTEQISNLIVINSRIKAFEELKVLNIIYIFYLYFVVSQFCNKSNHE